MKKKSEVTIAEAKPTQVLEIPNSSTWLTDYDLGAKIDDLRAKYKIKSIFIHYLNNVVVEIFK